jgi:hypothetical protein
MPAPTLTGEAKAATSPDAKIGAGSDESGIFLDNFDGDLQNPAVEFFDRYGAPVGEAIGHAASLAYRVNGEIADLSTGVLSATFIAAMTLANNSMFADTGTTMHGVDFSSADIALRDAQYTQPRGNPGAVTLNALRRLGFAY